MSINIKNICYYFSGYIKENYERNFSKVERWLRSLLRDESFNINDSDDRWVQYCKTKEAKILHMIYTYFSSDGINIDVSANDTLNDIFTKLNRSARHIGATIVLWCKARNVIKPIEYYSNYKYKHKLVSYKDTGSLYNLITYIYAYNYSAMYTNKEVLTYIQNLLRSYGFAEDNEIIMHINLQLTLDVKFMKMLYYLSGYIIEAWESRFKDYAFEIYNIVLKHGKVSYEEYHSINKALKRGTYETLELVRDNDKYNIYLNGELVIVCEPNNNNFDENIFESFMMQDCGSDYDAYITHKLLDIIEDDIEVLDAYFEYLSFPMASIQNINDIKHVIYKVHNKAFCEDDYAEDKVYAKMCLNLYRINDNVCKRVKCYIKRLTGIDVDNNTRIYYFAHKIGRETYEWGKDGKYRYIQNSEDNIYDDDGNVIDTTNKIIYVDSDDSDDSDEVKDESVNDEVKDEITNAEVVNVETKCEITNAEVNAEAFSEFTNAINIDDEISDVYAEVVNAEVDFEVSSGSCADDEDL